MKKNGGIIRPKRVFRKHFELINLADLRVLKQFSKKKSSFLSSRFISTSLHFLLMLSSPLSYTLSSFPSSCLLSLLSSSLLCFVLIFSSLAFHIISSILLFSSLASSLAFFSCLLLLSRLLLSCLSLSLFSFFLSLSLFLCLSFSIFFLCLSLYLLSCLSFLSLSLFLYLLALSLSVSLSVPVCPCLRVLLWWLLLCLVCMSLWSWCVRAVWCGTLKTPACTFKTSLCVLAPRPHVSLRVVANRTRRKC